ncbi:hypothetical protein [Piscinibacter sp. XHJ-5]|uniref:glycine-rich domain-containing protein n=1 Tax=Piscinibacter sp. XHJ-5 TaxID=3037797 RepID=UPI002452DCC3|nr:hypothetical protein [Piscinibacter sp. XHJ-5]
MTSKTNRTLEQTIAAIEALDLAPIKFKATRSEDGYGWSEAYADRMEMSYKRYLILHAKYPEMTLAPDQDTDRFWHMHILDTMKYAADCEATFGHFLHHFPYLGLRGEDDAKALDEAFAQMQALYATEFGANVGEADAAWCAMPGKQADAAWCAMPGKQADAAWCAMPGKQADAAWCAMPGKQADAAWCAMPGKQADAAWCAMPGKQADAAWCAMPGKQADAAWCAMLGKQADAAWCAMPGKQASPAWCAIEPVAPTRAAWCAMPARQAA